MLAQVRAFAKSPVATVLLGILVAAFAVFGIGDVFRNRMTPDTVVKAGSRTVNGAEFKQMFDNYRKQLEQRNGGQPITAEQAANAGVDRALVDNLANSESYGAMLARMGVAPSDKQVVAELRKIPAFFDQLTGKFDANAYRERLQGAGLTEAQFERGLRDQIAQAELASGLAAGLTVPRSYLAPVAIYNKESRAFTWFTLAPGVAGPPAKPTDAELTAYIKQNAARFTKPELRQLSFVRFSAAEAAKALPVNEADVQKRFNFEKDTLSTPETRSFVQVPVKDAAAGAAAVARLRRGEDPKAVAKSLGVDTVAYQDAPKTAVSDRKIAEAVYAPNLKAGDVAGPVQGSLGLAVVKVDKVAPGHQATLDEARPKIEAEIKKDAATDQVYKVVQKYDDARSGGANMAEAAAKAGVKVLPLPVPITAQGTSLQGQQAGVPAKLLQSAFSLPQGGESDVIDLGQGEYAAVRVEKVMPSALASLDEVRPAATQLFILQDLQKKLQAKADQLTAAIKKGGSLDQAAASVGAKTQTAADIRRDGNARGMFSDDLLGKVFNAKAGDLVMGEDVKLGLVVAKLDRIATAPIPELAGQVEIQRDGFRNVLFEDVTAESRNAARAKIKPKLDYNRARTAIGLEVQTPAGGKKK